MMDPSYAVAGRYSLFSRLVHTKFLFSFDEVMQTRWDTDREATTIQLPHLLLFFRLTNRKTEAEAIDE